MLIISEEIQKGKKALNDADAILITAGAGMGVDSGLPDYRGDKGFWKAYPLFKKLSCSFSKIMTPELFTEKPELAWGFYGHRLGLYRNTSPHYGFHLLRELCKNKKGGYFIVTSNVDGQFQKSGFEETNIFEIHGSIHHTQCHNRCCSEVFENDIYDYKICEETLTIDHVPKCKYCQGSLRPNILMFSDGQLRLERLMIQEERYSSWLRDTEPYKLVILEIGAGPDIPAVREYGESISQSRSNATLIRINPFDNDDADICIKMGALEALKSLLE